MGYRKIRALSDLVALYRLRQKSSYLRDVGWFDSFSKRMSINSNGEVLPWFTYAAIAFLDQRIRKEMLVFEFGSGSSTIWWGDRVSKVVSCEHNAKWYKRMKPKLLHNIDYLYYDLEPSGAYSKSILKYSEEFDIIVIDGRDRVNCARNALQALKPDGVIVWDNSDLEKHQQGYGYILANGFKRLDFVGIKPINNYGCCTSVFYRSENCLGI